MNFIEKLAFATIGLVSILFINNDKDKVEFSDENQILFFHEEENKNSLYIERPIFVKNLVYEESVILNKPSYNNE
tara:strand:- start:397 stop:621 length:225 start_codon:yes stop_codon:yes gene_type:complete